MSDLVPDNTPLWPPLNKITFWSSLVVVWAVLLLGVWTAFAVGPVIGGALVYGCIVVVMLIVIEVGIATDPAPRTDSVVDSVLLALDWPFVLACLIALTLHRPRSSRTGEAR